MKYTLKDISIVQSAVSIVESRSQCNTKHPDGMLPLFTAPMSSVVNTVNCSLFQENKINAIIPRNVGIEDRYALCTKQWCAFSLDEFIELVFGVEIDENEKVYALIDVANGAMKKLHDIIKKAKEHHGNKIKIMAGNVGNPETYVALCEAGADYVRVGIGGGSMCLTSTNTGVHYPMGSLIKECFDMSLELTNPAFIIADGGIRNYDDIIKCLALGADYVMCGSIFNKMLESAGDTYNIFDDIVDPYSEEVKSSFSNGDCLEKAIYGMSTERAQIEIGNGHLKVEEGIEDRQEVEYTMAEWVRNFEAYLKSTMSYTSFKELGDFIGNAKTIIISNNSSEHINKPTSF